MLFDQLIAETDTRPADDWLELSWAHCIRRAGRHQTRSGKTVRLLLPVNQVLRHESRIGNGETIVAVDLQPCEVLVIRPDGPRAATLVGLGLGNLHAPTQVVGHEIVTLPDGPSEEMLNRLKIAFTRDSRRFEPDMTMLPNLRVSADFALLNP